MTAGLLHVLDLLNATLLHAGVHVLCEKPIASAISGGTKLVDFARKRETSVKLMIGYHRRFNKYITATKQLLLRLGRIVAISGLWCLYKPSNYFEPPIEWRGIAKLEGPILINLIHEIDILQSSSLVQSSTFMRRKLQNSAGMKLKRG